MNPQLGTIAFDPANPLLRHHALLGAASLLNPDDISFFLGTYRFDGDLVISTLPDVSAGWAQLYDQVRACAKQGPDWAPAPETLKKMQGLLPSL